MKAAKYALLSFYLDCVKVSGWTVFKEVRIAEPEVLLIVPGRAEVQALLAAVREPCFRAALRLIYHCGLPVFKYRPIVVCSQSGGLAVLRCRSSKTLSPGATGDF